MSPQLGNASPQRTFDDLAKQVLEGTPASLDDALAILKSSDEQLLEVVAAAYRLRSHYFGKRVKLNFLVNVKSGLCPEDCSYCSQSRTSKAEVLHYKWVSAEQAVVAASAGIQAGARRVCLVASGRAPTTSDLERLAETAQRIKAEGNDIEICACLGLLTDQQAKVLAEAGVDAYNHNLNTSRQNYASICSTHDFDDRVRTVRTVSDAGLSPCSGFIAGMGETDEELVELCMELRSLGSESIPVNFLMPFEGTPFDGRWELTPQRCLRILAMVRFVCPEAELRVAGGREMHLRSLQPLSLYVANSIFLGDYLTSEGQPSNNDLQMIADAGFSVEGAEGSEFAPAVAPRLRRRGPGTELPPNAEVKTPG